MSQKIELKKGFTLIELAIVTAIVGILATGIIIAIKPGARFAQMRDMKRKEHLERIYSAIQNKLLSEEGAWLDCPEIPFEPTYIGKEEGNYDLYACLIPQYLSKELYDPQDGTPENSGYEIWRTGLGEIGLRAKKEYPPGYIIVGALPNLPIVTTMEPKNITDISVETGGKVHYQGGGEVTERGIVWDTQPRPTLEDNKTTAGAGLGEFEVTLSSLEPETTYYLRAYAINEMGVAYGQEYSFQTQTPTYPRIETKEATQIKVHSATLNGEVLSLGVYSSVNVYFEYRRKGENGWPFSTSKILTGQTGTFSQTISGLEENTTYEFRFIAEYSDGKTVGKILEFTTLSADPLIETKPADNITWNSAVLHGKLISLGIYSQVEVYFLYKQTNEVGWIATSPQTKTSPGEFSASLADLEELTEYEFKAVVRYEGKKIEGEVLTFSTTQIPPPVVETLDVSFDLQPGNLKANLKGNLVSLGGYSQVEGYFRYKKEGVEQWNFTSKSPLGETGYFTQTIEGLEINTSYKFEALVDYDQKTAYGGISTFTTPSGEVEVITKSPEIIGRQATLKGEITTLGIYTEAWVYFKFRKVGDSSWYQTQKAKMTSPGVFSATIGNLQSNTTYEFLALADYDGKTAQGYIVRFTTQKTGVEIATLEAVNITVESATLRGEILSFGDYSPPVYAYFKIKKAGGEWQTTQKQEINNLGEFSKEVFGLEINTTYQFRAVVEFNGETAQGEIKTFSTPKEGAKVQTNPATEIETDSVVLNGQITYLFGYSSLEAFFQYKKAGEQNWQETPSQTLYGEESFNYPLSGLTENTLYEFRAVASYGGGKIVYGEILSFTTLDSVKIQTQPASNISHFEALLNGTVLSLGSFPQVDTYFQYRKEREDEWQNTSKTSKDAPGDFSSLVSNLSSDTTYQFRAMADYINPTTQKEYTAQGEILTFTTPKVPVEIETITLGLNDYTGDTAILRGRIVSLGDYPSAKVFFRFKQPQTPWYQTQKTQVNSLVEFYANVSGLLPNTETQYQALAEFDGKIAQGTILTFTTDPEEFRVETKNASQIKPTSALLNGRVTSLGIYHQGQVYFQYKKSNEGNWSTTQKITLSQKEDFSIQITNLSPSTTYQFRAMADYNGKTWEGSILSFTTISSYIDGTVYSRPVFINNTQNASNLSDYQILVVLDTKSLISAGKMRSDCADLRFTDSDKITKLSYWLQSGCNTQNTKFWVKVPLIPAKATKTIYLFYGNPSLGSESNKLATFPNYFNQTKEACCFSDGCYITHNFSLGNFRPAPDEKFLLNTWVEGDLNYYKEYVSLYLDNNFYKSGCTGNCGQCPQKFYSLFLNLDVTSYLNDGKIAVKGDASSHVDDFCDWKCSNHALIFKAQIKGRMRKYLPPEPTITLGEEE